MADENQPALVSMAQQFSGLDMGQLIGAPLMAAAKANQQMALTQVQFMLDTCFNWEDGKGGDSATATLTPIMVDMILTRGVISEGEKEGDVKIEPLSTTISIPLLTILPLNSLGVDNVDVGFVMEVKSSYGENKSSSSSSSTKAEASFDAKFGGFLWSVNVRGSVSHDTSSSSSADSHYQKSNSATYNVSVHAGQLPLPGGVKTIIDAYAQNISPIELGKSS